MATKVIKYDSFKRGDTPVFGFNFTEPYDGFDWSTVTVDGAITSVSAPVDNSGAGVYRSNQTLTINADNSARFSMQPTIAESKALTAGTTYKVECQLKEGSTNVTTPVTGEVTILQDYVV